MDLPTYTNIWRIEKRLYKLYDLRLPMPLPLGQIAAFAGITVPYVLFLTLIGIPFSHNLFWLYVLPPWALTWLATRPVLENKRLPELLVSQVRYLGEPSVWCRMAPAQEKDEIVVTGRVWHARRQVALEPAASRAHAQQRVQAHSGQPRWAAPEPAASRRRAEPRHRKVAAPQPQPAMATAGQVPVRGQAGGPAGPPAVVHWAHRGPAPARGGGAIAHEVRPRGPASPPAARRAAAPGPWSRAAAAPRTAAPPGSPDRPAAAGARDRAAAAPRTAAPAAAARQRWTAAGPWDRGAAHLDRAPAPWDRAAAAGDRAGMAPGARAPHRPGRPAAPPADSGRRPEWATRAHPGAIGGWPAGAGGSRALEVAHAEQGQAAERKAARPGWDPKQPPGPAGPGTPARLEAGRPGPAAAGWRTAGSARSPGDVPWRPEGVRWRPGDVRRGPGDVRRRPGGPVGWSAGAAPAQAAGRGIPAAMATPEPDGRPKHAGEHARPAMSSRGGPGQPAAGEREERDQALARMPLPGPRRIVVLGCTSGAGQTVTTLLTARTLASLRAEPVGALALNPGDGALARRSQCAPAGTVDELLGAALPAIPAPGVEMICAGTDAAPGDGLVEHDFAAIGERLAARYLISLVDPDATAVARALSIADQLVLVAPASGDAPHAVTMTMKWLDANEHGELAANAVLVLNGVSSRSLADVEQAEAVALGRCRAIIRVPWVDQLGSGRAAWAGTAPLGRPARQAVTELAAVLVSGLAGRPGDQR